MERLAILLELYSDSHQHPVNRIMHWIGVPLVLFASLLFFSWLHLSMPGLFDIHCSWLFWGAISLYYARLDIQSSLLLSVILLPFIFLANIISSYWLSFPFFCLLFAIGWILQLVGYYIEDEIPLFITKPMILTLLPLLVLVEMLQAKGLRPQF